MSGNLIPINFNNKPVVQQVPQQVTLPPLKLPDISLQNQLPLIPIDLNISPQFEQNTNIQPSVPVFTPDTSLTKPNENNSFEKSGMEKFGAEFKRVLQDDSGSLDITRVLEIYDNIKKKVSDYISGILPFGNKTQNQPVIVQQTDTTEKAPIATIKIITHKTDTPETTPVVKKLAKEINRLFGDGVYYETIEELLANGDLYRLLFEGEIDENIIKKKIELFRRCSNSSISSDEKIQVMKNINKALTPEIYEKYSDFMNNQTEKEYFINNLDILLRNPEFLEAKRKGSELYLWVFARLAEYMEENPECRNFIINNLNNILCSANVSKFKRGYEYKFTDKIKEYAFLFDTGKFNFKECNDINNMKEAEKQNILELVKEFKEDENITGDIILQFKNINITAAGKDILHKMSQNKNFNDYWRENPFCLAGIIGLINEDNLELAKLICLNEKFLKNWNTRGCIYHILKNTNDKNIELAKLICSNEKFLKSEDTIKIIRYILEYTNDKNIELAKLIYSNEKFTENEDYIGWIPSFLKYTNDKNIELAKQLCTNERFLESKDSIRYISYILAHANEKNIKFAEHSIMAPNNFEKIENYKNKMLQNPELYVNGENDDGNEKIEDFFYDNIYSLTLAFEIFDKETIDNLMRRRLEDAGKYLFTLKQFNTETLMLLQKIVCCNNMSDKPLMPSQKVECIDLIKAFEDNNISLSIIENAIVDNKVDLGSLKTILFKEILKNCGMKEEQIENIPKEKLMSWDLEYMHLLPKSIEKDSETFTDLLNAANSDDFMKYIHDTNNDYGIANGETIKQFEELNMNYEKWENPDKNLETTFTSKDKNTELILQLSNLLLEDINELRNTPVKGFFDKQFSKFIQNGKFALPNEVTTSKANLTELIKNIIEQLKPVWERAEKNKDNPQKKEAATKTLTILSHLKTKVESLQNIQEVQKEKSYNLTIKMWDRNPQKDLFQGNFSTCCIGMGEVNGEAMPHYLMNTAFNMIEMVDNNSGKTIGNALCYFVQDRNRIPIFVVDNIEINNSQKPSDKTGIELRKKIFEYASNVAKSVTGKETDVIMSGSYNDVSLDGLKERTKELKPIGDIDCEEIYMDLFDGWTDDWDEFKEVECYEE